MLYLTFCRTTEWLTLRAHSNAAKDVEILVLLSGQQPGTPRRLPTP